MLCSKAAWVESFVAGRFDDRALADMEAHIEECEECFLRVAAVAGEIPDGARSTLSARSNVGSRLSRCLQGGSVADTTLSEHQASAATDGSRRIIGPYVVTGFLGIGGMSIVYRARHQLTGREVAVKTVKMPFVASFLAMLRQEVEFLQETKHPGIVAVLDSDLAADDPWYAMELFEGPTMYEFNRRLWNSEPIAGDPGDLPIRSSLPPAAGGRLGEILELFARLCAPLACIHGAGMVHGDIKPSNVFLRPQQQPVLMDFGLASRAKGSIGREALDVTGRIRGTLPYIAPEAIRGQLPDARADLYSLGCMLYESIVGAPPFVSSSGTRIIDMHLTVMPAPASRCVSGVPAELDELLLRLLAKNPRDRFGHATALGVSLTSIADSLSPSASPPKRSLVSSESTMPLFRPPLVGRDADVESILAKIQQAERSSVGGLFLVSGESGIGKTFFTTEVAQRALLTGIQVVTGECVPFVPTNEPAADAGTAPLQPFRRFFQTLRDRCRERGPEEVERLFGGRLEVLSAYVPALRYLRRHDDTNDAPSRLPSSAARERIVSAVVDTIAAYVSKRCVLLALDDLQWADDLSLAVLDRLDGDFFSQAPLVVLGNYRTDEAGESLRRLARKSSTRDLSLTRLVQRDIGEMVGGMLSMTAPPATLVEYVHAQAEGVPFFAAEYLRALVGEGVLIYEKGAWTTRAVGIGRAADGSEARMPRTLQQLIQGRLQHLPPDVVELLEAGAVVGRHFAAPLISQIVGRPVSDVVTAVASAVTAQIVDSHGFDSYTFLHDKIRETLYAGLSAERRAHLHRQVARAMEEERPISPEQYGALGHHLRKAGEDRRSVEYLEKAGEHALAMASNADAERFFREALALEATLSPRLPILRRACWLRQRGDALQGLGMMADSTDALKASAALLGRPFPTGKAAFIVRLSREVFRQLLHRLRPQAIKPPPADLVAANEEVVRVFDRMHQASFYLGRDTDLVFSTTVSLNASERGGPTPSLAWAYTNAAMMAGVLPLPKLANHYFQLAGAVIEKSPDAAAESWLLLMEGAYRTWLGARERSVSCLDRAIVLLREHGHLRRCDEAECARAGIDVFAGYHVPAWPRVEAVETQARKRHDLQIQCWAILQRAEIYSIREQYDAALAEIVRARSLLAPLGRPEWIWAMGFESYVRCRLQETDAAQHLAQECLDLISRGPPVHSYCVSTYDRLAETTVRLCRLSAEKSVRRSRIALAKQACGVLARAIRVFPMAWPAAALHRGTLALMLGRARPLVVEEQWREGIRVARELTLPHVEMRLCLALLARMDEIDPERLLLRRRIIGLLNHMELHEKVSLEDQIDWLTLKPGVKVERKVELPALRGTL